MQRRLSKTLLLLVVASFFKYMFLRFRSNFWNTDYQWKDCFQIFLCLSKEGVSSNLRILIYIYIHTFYFYQYMHTLHMAGIHNSWSKVSCWEGWVAFQDLTSHLFYEAGRVLNGALHSTTICNSNMLNTECSIVISWARYSFFIVSQPCLKCRFFHQPTQIPAKRVKIQSQSCAGTALASPPAEIKSGALRDTCPRVMTNAGHPRNRNNPTTSQLASQASRQPTS